MWRHLLLACGIVSSAHAAIDHKKPVPDRHFSIEQSSMLKDVRQYPQTVCLALALYEEARGEPVAAQVGVGLAILNRVKTNGMTICQTLWEGYGRQFQWVTKRNLQPKEQAPWLAMQNMAKWLLSVPDPTFDFTYGATQFYSPKICHCHLPGLVTASFRGMVFVRPINWLTNMPKIVSLRPSGTQGRTHVRRSRQFAARSGS